MKKKKIKQNKKKKKIEKTPENEIIAGCLFTHRKHNCVSLLGIHHSNLKRKIPNKEIATIP